MSWDASISYIARDLFVEGTDCCALADYMAWKRIAHTIFTYLR
jgi:hypothetical protein